MNCPEAAQHEPPSVVAPAAEIIVERFDDRITVRDAGAFFTTLLASVLNRADAITNYLADFDFATARREVNTAYNKRMHADELEACFAKLGEGSARIRQRENQLKTGNGYPNQHDAHAIANSDLQKDWCVSSDVPALLEGDRPLHIAARFGSDTAVAALLQAGADDRAVNTRGDTPLDIAARGGTQHALVWKLLQCARAARATNRLGIICELWLAAGSQRSHSPHPIVFTSVERAASDFEEALAAA